MSKVHFHEIVNSFYVKLGLDYRSKLVHGQICFSVVHYCYENRQIWRPSGLDSSSTQATFFQIEPSPGDAYSSGRVLHTPKLGAGEEFPVVRAKRRPVVVLLPPREQIDTKDSGGAMKINKKLTTVAPCYGLVDEMGNSKLDPAFLGRVGMLEFEHFMFLPGQMPLDKDSLLRLDSATHVFYPHLEPTQHALSEEVWNVVAGQLQRLLKTGPGDDYLSAREQLMKQ